MFEKKEINNYPYLDNFIYLDEFFIRKFQNVFKLKNEGNDENHNYDLSYNGLIKILMEIEPKKIYNSNIFIFKEKEIDKIILVPIQEKNEIIINLDTNNKFKIFLTKNNIKDNELIYIQNYFYENNNISFNSITLFNIAKCEHIDKFIQKKLIMNNDKDIKINSISHYNKDLIKKQIFDCIFLKVIEMNESFLLGIDHDYIIYKIYKNNNKVNKIDELYTLILIKDYTLSKEDEIFNTLAINENSYIYTFENSFYDSVLNDLTVLYLNIIDLVDPIENNYYNEIALEINYIQKINYTFNIKKKYEYFIINTKIDFFYNY